MTLRILQSSLCDVQCSHMVHTKPNTHTYTQAHANRCLQTYLIKRFPAMHFSRAGSKIFFFAQRISTDTQVHDFIRVNLMTIAQVKPIKCVVHGKLIAQCSHKWFQCEYLIIIQK